MREIEFRGKTIPQLLNCKKDKNGKWVQNYTESEWVYGYYAPVYLCERDGKTQNRYAIISDEFIGQPEMTGRNINTGLPKMFEILENTLGQYTGLKDKNGKKIFEGDILKVVPKERAIDNQDHYDYVVFADGCFCMANAFMFSELSYGCNYDVVGNIYDNKELLEEQDVKD